MCCGPMQSPWCSAKLGENERLITSANNELDQGQKRKTAEECVIKSTYLAFIYPNIWMNHISDKIKPRFYVNPPHITLYASIYNG